ncbi:MAG: hypothetical protein PHP69_06440 [Candidatus Omnitrophica bacterium]|nr:hypothetical protein [Candidatus Omnitrophota bacterium]
MKINKKIVFIVGIILIFLFGSCGVGGYYIYSKIRDSMDPIKKDKTARGIFSYELLPNYELSSCLDMWGFKMATFERKDNKQVLIIASQKEDKKLNEKFFKLFLWNIDEEIDDEELNRKKEIYLANNGMENLKVNSEGEIELENGKKMPYIIQSHISEGEYYEGFWGVINFDDSMYTLMVTDWTPDKGKYDFDLTKEFLEKVGPPK